MPSRARLPLTLSSTCCVVMRVMSPFCRRYLLPYPAHFVARMTSSRFFSLSHVAMYRSVCPCVSALHACSPSMLDAQLS